MDVIGEKEHFRGWELLLINTAFMHVFSHRFADQRRLTGTESRPGPGRGPPGRDHGKAAATLHLRFACRMDGCGRVMLVSFVL